MTESTVDAAATYEVDLSLRVRVMAPAILGPDGARTMAMDSLRDALEVTGFRGALLDLRLAESPG